MLQPGELEKLQAACRRLPDTAVRTEEAYVAETPILILMSTVLSLNRRWYEHALPARRHFEEHVLPALTPKTLVGFRKRIGSPSTRSEWTSTAVTLWGMREWDKARQLAELVDHVVAWSAEHAPELGELEAMRRWAASTSKPDFLGLVKGLGPRAYEQLTWYIEGVQSIKLDRHISKFVDEVLGRSPSEEEKLTALRKVAAGLGLEATELDARIWDFMQSRSARDTASTCD